MDTCWIRRPSIKSIIIAFTTLMIMPVTGCDKLASNSLPNVDQEDINQLNDSTPTAAPTPNIIENQKALLKQKNLYVWDDAFVPDDKIEENVATAFASANYMMKVIDPSIYNKSEDKVKFAKGCETMFFWYPECSYLAYKLLAITDLASKRGPVLGDLTGGLIDGSISCSKVSELVKPLEIQEITKEDFSNIKDKFCSIDNPFDTSANHNDNLNALAVGNTPTVNKMPDIPALIPEPEITMAPEERLRFTKSIKSKKGKPEYLIFHDSQLNTPCYIAVHNSNIQAQDENRYCTPFSGNEKDLTHPMAVTKTATEYENYAYCAANLKPEKRNIPGLAGFFKAFNPTYYASDLARFIDDPFQIHKPKSREGSKNNFTDYSYYIPDPNASDDEACESQDTLIPNPFITEEEYQKYNLKPGVVFLTASAAKGEKVLHQYWQIINGQPEEICECEWEVYDNCKSNNNDDDCAGGSGGCQLGGNIIQVRDLDSKDTYELLAPQILDGMPGRNQYCEAVNNALINEARAGKWARVDNDSPLMKKK